MDEAAAFSLKRSMIKSAFVRFGGINGIPTKVLTLGSGIADKPKKLILVVPGNPGLAGFYEEFMETLFAATEQKVPVWALSHVGHEIPEDQELRKAMPPLQGNENLYNLRAQIRHKIDFISEFVPADCDLTLIGHSIGCKMALEAMRHFRQKEESSRRIRAYLLFPTIERMYETPSGRRVWIMVAYLKRLIAFLVFLLNSLLPKSVLKSLVEWHLRRCDTISSTSCVQTTLALLDPTIIFNSLSLAHDELNTVRELDVEAVKEVSKQTRFYFGTIDGWCPLSYYHDMKRKLGDDLDAVVCQQRMEHAFVLSSSVEMAVIVAEWYRADYDL